MNNTTLVTRSLAILGALGLLMVAARGEDQAPDPQPCDGQARDYSLSSRPVYNSMDGFGYAPTVAQARSYAAIAIQQEIDALVTPACEECEGGDRCLYSRSYDWEGYTMYDPQYEDLDWDVDMMMPWFHMTPKPWGSDDQVFDDQGGSWRVYVETDDCTVTQTCRECD